MLSASGGTHCGLGTNLGGGRYHQAELQYDILVVLGAAGGTHYPGTGTPLVGLGAAGGTPYLGSRIPPDVVAQQHLW